MATCFPFIRYVFFIALFIISTTILKTSTTLEVVGFNVLNIFGALFGISIAADVMEYTTRPLSKNKYIAYLFSAGALMLFVGILLTTIAYDKMVLEYAEDKLEFKLDKSYRQLVEEIKDISISTISLTIVSSIAIFYRWEDLREIFNILIDPLVNTHIFSAWLLRIILCIVVISLGISILGSEDYVNNLHLKGYYYSRFFTHILLPIFIIYNLFSKGNNKYFWILVWSSFIIIGTALAHGMMAKIPDYEYNRYEKPLYGVAYVLGSLSILDAGSIYTPNALTALFKVGMPLATVGLSAYLVYLGSKFFELSKNSHIK
jgi:hypothetical protein